MVIDFVNVFFFQRRRLAAHRVLLQSVDTVVEIHAVARGMTRLESGGKMQLLEWRRREARSRRLLRSRSVRNVTPLAQPPTASSVRPKRRDSSVSRKIRREDPERSHRPTDCVAGRERGTVSGTPEESRTRSAVWNLEGRQNDGGRDALKR